MTDVVNVQITASLIDDYLQLEIPPIAPDLSGCFTAMPDPNGQPMLLAVSSSGEAMMVFSANSASPSGWSAQHVTITPPANASSSISQLIGFSTNSTPTVLVLFPLTDGGGSAVVLLQAQSGTWAQVSIADPNMASRLENLQQISVYTDSAGSASTTYIYGLSCKSFFLCSSSTASGAIEWSQVPDSDCPLSADPFNTDDAVAFQIFPGNGGPPGVLFNVAWLEGGNLTYLGAAINDNIFSWTKYSSPTTINIGSSDLTINDIFLVPQTQGVVLLVRDSAQALYACENLLEQSISNTVQLTGGASQPAGAASVCLGVNASNLVIVFVVEASTNLLWIGRQGTGTTDDPLALSWSCLGDTLNTISCPATTSAAAELFMVDLSQNIFHMAQTPTDLVWAASQVATVSPSTNAPQNLATVTMEIATLDVSQTAVPNVVISVTSDQIATIIAADLAYPLAPNVALPLQTDATGRLTVAMQMTNLMAPVLTFACQNSDGTIASRWCQGDVVQVLPVDPVIPPCPQSVPQRLSNQDPTLPITGSSLITANILAPDYPDATSAANVVIACGNWLAQSSQSTGNTINVSQVSQPNWKMDFTLSSQQFQSLSGDQVATVLSECRARRASADIGSVASIFGDVVHALERDWSTFETIVASATSDVLTLIINGVEYTVSTLRQALGALQAVFNRIVQGATDAYNAMVNVIEFLKQLFDWSDILQTHLVLKWGVQQLVNKMITEADDVKKWIDGEFSKLKADINSNFSKAEAIFQSGSFNSFVNNQTGPSFGASNALAASDYTNAYSQNQTRCNYIASKAKSAVASSPSLLALRSSGTDDPSAPIKDRVSRHWSGDKFNSLTDGFSSYISSNTGSSASLFDLGVVDFLNACEAVIDLILSGLEDIVDAVLDAVKDSLTELSKWWNHKIDIPVISWLYENVITATDNKPGDALTGLDLFCLLLAVPVTVIYKVLNSNNAPFTANEVSTVTANSLPWPSLSGEVSETAAGTSVIPASFIQLMGVTAGIAEFFAIFLDVGNDTLAFSPAPDEGLQTFFSVAGVIEGVVCQVGGAPWNLFGTAPHEWGTGDVWTTVLWLAQMVPIAYDSVFTFATGGLARYTDELGPVLDTGAGFALLAIGAATLVEQHGQEGSSYTGWDYAGDLISQVQLLFKFLLLTKDQPEAAIGMPVLLTVDGLVDLAAMVVQIGAAVEG